MNSTKSRLKPAAFWASLFVGSLIIVECFLHGLCLVSTKASALLAARPGLRLPDTKLGWRPNPNSPEHDSRGWRNENVPDRAAIVALGDSMTYGVWARRNDAWPQEMERMGGMKTYNMAFSGYDPTQYLLLSDEALELQPKLVIAAVYSGNDFWEAYSSVYTDGRLPELRSKDKALLNEFSARNKEVSVESESSLLFEPHRGLKDFLAEHSKIYALLWLFKAMFIPDHTWPWFWTKFEASRFPPWEVFEYGEVCTILTPTYRLLGLDLKDPRIREGLRLSLIALKETNDRLKGARVRFLVLFLPTKELVLEPFLASASMKDPETYNRLLQNEKFAWNMMREYLVSNQVLFVDALPELQRSVRAGKNPFLINHDAHPNREGHRAIAATVLTEIRAKNLLH